MAKEELINKDGQASFGIFPDGVDTINYMDFDLRNAMDKRRSTLAKRFKFNQFQFIGFTCDKLIVGLAIVDLKIASNCFIYIYDPESKEYAEHSFINPLAFNTQIDTQPNSGNSFFRKGNNKVSIEATAKPRLRSVNVDLESGIKISAVIDESGSFEPLALCVRAGYEGFHFTQKSTALICNGLVEWGDKKIVLEEIGALASVDWSAGYMRRETAWNWGSLSCNLPDGRRLGFNLAAGVVETGFTENAVWIDGKMHKVDMVDFQFDRYHHSHAWSLRSNDGIINLHFEPAGQRKEKTNAIIAATNFTQHFGRYYGEILINGETIHLDGEWGFTEDHYAKW
ncbi:MAG: hypothetical protein ACJARQ_001018 [Oleispira sp.]|jgi:hypothetical protein